MYKKKHDTDEKIAAILQLLATFSRGETVGHNQISQVSGLEPGTQRYYALVRRARDLYRKSNGVWTRGVDGIGYMLLTTEQSLNEEQEYRRRRMRKQANIGQEVAKTLPDNLLSDHQKRLREHILESYARTRNDLLEAQRHERWLLRPAADRPMRTAPPRNGTEST